MRTNPYILGIKPGWTIEDLPNIVFWHKIDSISGLSDDDPISTILAGGSTSYNAIQTTASYKPIYKTAIQNGLPVARFAGTDDSLYVDGAAASFSGQDEPMTIVIAAAASDLTMDRYLFSFGNSADGDSLVCIYMQSSQGKWRMLRRADDGSVGYGYLGAADTNPHIFVLVFNGTTTTCYIDGVKTMDALASDVTTLTLNRFTYGAERRTGNPTHGFYGDFFEGFGCAGVLSDLNINTSCTYLATKWGLTWNEI